MGDAEFEDDLRIYLEGIAFPNLEMADVEIVWVRGQTGFGADHIARNGVKEHEVEEVLFEVPPDVEAKTHPEHPGRTLFWGATREGRWLFVSCEDWTEGGTRYLKPITAFEPDEGYEYWRKQ
ncbi:MAG: hypothetical protein L0Y72_21630 [Gemmataceae bacterium]|nr:hypothetical protein [Gemmataceae bacterium]